MQPAGRSLRKSVPRSAFGSWVPASDRPDPLALIAAEERGRVAELLPIRHERMRASPFAFYRGAAAVMAADLAGMAVTGLRAQLCGDAHLSNFGGFATPERRLVFDVNDFDETLPGPWEWDVLRLAASVEIAARDRNLGRKAREDAVCACGREYRLRMRELAALTPLEIWYSRIDVRRVAELHESRSMGPGEHLPPKLVRDEHGRLAFRANPPLVVPLDAADERAAGARSLLALYGASLPTHVRALIERYTLVGLARKVVGVGSVGTRCLVALFVTQRDEPLILQLKEATSSALEPYVAPSAFASHAERVVVGQRLMQAAADLFLGWTRIEEHDFYVRQLRDMKVTVDINLLNAAELADYASHCGWALARAHARTSDPQAIGEYLGRSGAFERALTDFAAAYADQNQRDYETFCKARWL